MGCDVLAFSSTESKESDALFFGASAYYTTQSSKDAKIGRLLDWLIVTASAPPDWSIYLPLLAPKAKIFPLTIGPGNLAMPSMPLLLNGITVQGSVLSPRNVHERMLDFAVRHGIKPVVHRFTMNREGVEQAFGVLKEGKMKYRGVLVVPEQERR